MTPAVAQLSPEACSGKGKVDPPDWPRSGGMTVGECGKPVSRKGILQLKLSYWDSMLCTLEIASLVYFSCLPKNLVLDCSFLHLILSIFSHCSKKLPQTLLL